MCGIFGFMDPGGTLDDPEDVLKKAADCMFSRGPDYEGAWFDRETGTGFSHRRLAVIDTTAKGKQPMISASGRSVLCYNGELYNFRELKRDLQGIVPSFRSETDTEVLLEYLEHHGISDSLPRFNGMFAFGYLDRQSQTLYLARDRPGIKPLYYGTSGGLFVFASTLAPFFHVPGFQKKIDRQALGMLLKHNYIPAPFSIFQNIRKLRPGTFATVQTSSETKPEVNETVYWNADQSSEGTPPTPGSPREAVDTLEKLLEDSVTRRMIADVPLGAFLSGGIDSSTVTALMQKNSPEPVKTFTIGFHEKSFNEAPYAKNVANHLGTDHTELYVGPETALDVIPDLPGMFDEPFADSSQIPTFLISKLAREEVTVSLSGDGGDELFCGYDRYFWTESIWRMINSLPDAALEPVRGALKHIPEPAVKPFLKGVLSLLPQKFRVNNPSDKAKKIARMLGKKDPVELYRGILVSWPDPEQIIPEYPQEQKMFSPGASPVPTGTILRTLMDIDRTYYLPDDLLTKVDRTSMAVSLEVRVPILDHRIIEFAGRLPRNLLTRDGRGKWILRQILNKHIPRELIDRPKQGFGVPVGEWLRGPLQDWANDLLDPSRLSSQGYLNPEPIRTKWREHQAKQHNWQSYLWSVLMFQAWYEHWF